MKAYKLIPLCLGLALLFIALCTLIIAVKHKVSVVTLVKKAWPVFINEYYASLIDTGGTDDPIAQMAIPDVDEMMGEGLEDTSGESSNTVVPGMQHK